MATPDSSFLPGNTWIHSYSLFYSPHNSRAGNHCLTNFGHMHSPFLPLLTHQMLEAWTPLPHPCVLCRTLFPMYHLILVLLLVMLLQGSSMPSWLEHQSFPSWRFYPLSWVQLHSHHHLLQLCCFSEWTFGENLIIRHEQHPVEEEDERGRSKREDPFLWFSHLFPNPYLCLT